MKTCSPQIIFQYSTDSIGLELWAYFLAKMCQYGSSCPDQLIQTYALQFMIIRAYVLIVAVFHSESVRDGPQLFETEPFVQMSRVNVVFDDSVELEDFESQFFSFFEAVEHQLLADMQSAHL